MTLTIILVVIGAIVIYQLNAITKHLRYMISSLASLDGELFHLAQEQNPSYGICSSCGQRTTVCHVLPKDQKGADEPDIFYCHRCYWLSNTVMMGDDKKFYKNRQTREDIIAANVGPGTP